MASATVAGKGFCQRFFVYMIGSGPCIGWCEISWCWYIHQVTDDFEEKDQLDFDLFWTLRIPSLVPAAELQHVTELHCWYYDSDLCFPVTVYRLQTAAQHSRFGRTRVLYADALVSVLLSRRFLHRKPNMLFAFLTVRSIPSCRIGPLLSTLLC